MLVAIILVPTLLPVGLLGRLIGDALTSMMLIAAMTASLVTTSGRSAWFVGVLALTVYAVFAMTLYLLPPRVA